MLSVSGFIQLITAYRPAPVTWWTAFANLSSLAAVSNQGSHFTPIFITSHFGKDSGVAPLGTLESLTKLSQVDGHAL